MATCSLGDFVSSVELPGWNLGFALLYTPTGSPEPADKGNVASSSSVESCCTSHGLSTEYRPSGLGLQTLVLVEAR